MIEKISILFVDDDKRILYAFKRVLSNTNYILHFADSADAAYAVLRKERVNIAIVDLKMPVVSGYEVLETIKNSFPTVLRIALIGHVDEKKILRALSSNLASTYIIKPWSSTELVNTINYYTELYKQIRERGILEAINAVDSLPTIPDIYYKISEAIDADKDMEELAVLIEKDHSISAKVIQVVNSAYFNIRTASIQKALVYLGFNNIKDIVLFQSIFENVKSNYITALWHHAELTNKIMLLIYNLLDKKLDEDLRSVALFHDIGKVVLINNYSSSYLDICDVYRCNEDEEIGQLEKERFGITHEEVGYYFMKLRGLREEIPEAALYHHDPLNPEILNKKLIKVIHIANHYSKKILEMKVNESELVEEVFDHIGLNREFFERRVLSLKE